MSVRVELAYLEHLTAGDLELLAGSCGVDVGGIRADPSLLGRLLARPEVGETIFGRDADREPFLRASPFLTFAVAVHRVAEELAGDTHVREWVGLRQRVPVFDVGALTGFLAPAAHRLFLAELLASYTHVVSGSRWVHTRRGWRRRRFSELDPVRLSSVLEVVSEAERPGVYRRLGDLALFLTGVFPDHTAARGFSLVDETRLRRAGGLGEEHRGALPEAVASAGAVSLLEELGSRWYGLAARSVSGPPTGTMAVAADLAERFVPARRVLNVVTDRYLFPLRSQYFGLGSG